MEVFSYFGILAMDLGIALAVLYSFALLGRATGLVAHETGWSPSCLTLWNVYIGIGTGAVVTSLLGMLGFFNIVSFLAIIAVGPLLSVANPAVFVEPWHAVRDAVRSLYERPVLGLAILVVAAVVVGPAAAPEIFYDALNYHLGLQSQYLIDGEIRFVPTFVHSAFPAYLDVLLGLCLGLGGPAVGKFFNVLLFWLGCCATAAFVQEVMADERAGLAGAVTVATIPGVVVMTTMCGIDAALIGFAAMAGLALARMRAASAGDVSRLVCLAAVGAGISAGSKYTGLWLVGALAVAIMVSLEPRRAFSAVLLFVGMSVLIASPWYVRNMLATGDPVYPVLSALMGNEEARWAVERLQRDVPAVGLSVSAIGELITGLLNNPGRFGAGAEPGVLVPLGLGAVLAASWRVPVLRPWAVAIVAYVVVWLSQSSVIRYIYPIFPFCALGVAYIVSGVTNWIRRSAPIHAVLVMLALLPIGQSIRTLDSLYGASDVAAMFTGTLSKDEYLSRRLAYYPAAQWINTHTPSDSHVYYLGETRLLYLNRSVSMSSAYDHNEIGALLAAAAPSFITHLKNRGVTHIVINGREIERLRSSYDYLAISVGAERELRVALAACRIVFAKSGVQVCELP